MVSLTIANTICCHAFGKQFNQRDLRPAFDQFMHSLRIEPMTFALLYCFSRCAFDMFWSYLLLVLLQILYPTLSLCLPHLRLVKFVGGAEVFGGLMTNEFHLLHVNFIKACWEMLHVALRSCRWMQNHTCPLLTPQTLKHTNSLFTTQYMELNSIPPDTRGTSICLRYM